MAKKMYKNNYDEIKHRQKMVKWFTPSLLFDVARETLISKIFGMYADKRLIRAGLQAAHRDQNKPNDFSDKKSVKKCIWLDYVADAGDGFNSTYTISYLLGQDTLLFDDGLNQKKLPRGDYLVMGGDEVYPRATRYDYKWRFEKPYEYSFPINKDSSICPALFMLPGNHDWYDGLTLFLAKYCRGPTNFGKSNWHLYQERSYFAVKLPDNWWVFGIDTQLCEDIDEPQQNYFVDVMNNESDKRIAHKIIICCSEPTWLTAKNKDEVGGCAYSRGIDHFVSNVIHMQWPNAKIYAVLTGDSHHYNRYEASDGTQFVTAGGGGAFLHPTHHLPETFSESWHGNNINFKLKKCYPDKKISKSILLGNLLFPFKNIKFCGSLGLIYTILALIIIGFHKLGVACLISQLGLIILLTYLFCKYNTKDDEYQKGGDWLGAVHGFIQAIALLFVAHTLFAFLEWQLTYFNISQWPQSIWQFEFLVSSIILSGLIGGFIFGTYLTIASLCFYRQYNDSFASLSLDSYKNFLRMKLESDKLIIYPIGVDTPSKAWKKNDSSTGSKYVPKDKINFKLIEDPIVIVK